MSRMQDSGIGDCYYMGDGSAISGWMAKWALFCGEFELIGKSNFDYLLCQICRVHNAWVEINFVLVEQGFAINRGRRVYFICLAMIRSK